MYVNDGHFFQGGGGGGGGGVVKDYKGNSKQILKFTDTDIICVTLANNTVFAAVNRSPGLRISQYWIQKYIPFIWYVTIYRIFD